MKEFIKALIIVLLSQLFYWGLFTLIMENTIIAQSVSEDIALIFIGLSLLILFILYFTKTNKYIKKNKLNSVGFKIALFVLWIIITNIIMFILVPLLEDNILHPCHQAKCFLNSIIYIIYGQLMIILAIIIGIIQFIITMINKLKTSK